MRRRLSLVCGLTLLSAIGAAQIASAKKLIATPGNSGKVAAMVQLIEAGDLETRKFLLDRWGASVQPAMDYLNYSGRETEWCDRIEEQLVRAVDAASNHADPALRKSALCALAWEQGYIDEFASGPIGGCGNREPEPEFSYGKSLAAAAKKNPDILVGLLSDLDPRIFYGAGSALVQTRAEDVKQAAISRLGSKDIRESRAALFLMVRAASITKQWDAILPHLTDPTPTSYDWVSYYLREPALKWAKMDFAALPPQAQMAVVYSKGYDCAPITPIAIAQKRYGVACAIIVVDDPAEKEAVALIEIAAEGAAKQIRGHPNRDNWYSPEFPFRDAVLLMGGVSLFDKVLDGLPAEIKAQSIRARMTQDLTKSREQIKRHWRSFSTLSGLNPFIYARSEFMSYDEAKPILLAGFQSRNADSREAAARSLINFLTEKLVPESEAIGMINLLANHQDPNVAAVLLDETELLTSDGMVQLYKSVLPRLERSKRLSNLRYFSEDDKSWAVPVLLHFSNSRDEQEAEVAQNTLRDLVSTKDG